MKYLGLSKGGYALTTKDENGKPKMKESSKVLGDKLADFIPTEPVPDSPFHATAPKRGGWEVNTHNDEENRSAAEIIAHMKKKISTATGWTNTKTLALQRIFYNYFVGGQGKKYDYEELCGLLNLHSYRIPPAFRQFMNGDGSVVLAPMLPELVRSLDSLGEYWIRREYEYESDEELYIIMALEVVLQRYKLKNCKHCGKWFFTSDMTTKYCDRNCLYMPNYGAHNRRGYAHLSCKGAVKNIKQDLARKKKKVDDSIRQKWGECSPELQLFGERGSLLRDMADSSPTVENLHKYEEFLYTYDYKHKEG